MPRALWAKAPLGLLRHRAALLAVVCAAFLVAIGAAAGPLLNAGADSEALQSNLERLTPLGAGLTIDRPLSPGRGSATAVAAADVRRRRAASALGRRLPFVGRPVLTTTTFSQFPSRGPDPGNPVEVVPMARTGATTHVHRISGGGEGVWLSSAVAHRAGGRVTFGFTGARVTLRVGRVYRSLESDLGNPYWVNFTARIRSTNPDAPSPPSFALMTTAQVYRIASKTSGGALGNDFEFPIASTAMTPGRARTIARAFDSVRRSLGLRSTLAKSLGCDDGRRPCSVTSELVDAVHLADAGNSSLRPVINLLSGFSLLVALAASLVTGVFTGRRRAAEARLSLLGGEPRSLFLARSAIEAVLPAALGAGAGSAITVELVHSFTPTGSVDSSVVRQAALRVILAGLVAVVAVALGATIARGRLGGAASRSRVALRLPWELAVLAVATAAWVVLGTGKGLVKDPVAGSHPRLAVLLLPALVAGPFAGIAGRVLRLLARRGVPVAAPAALLALRRVSAAGGLMVALTVSVAVGISSLAFAQILRSTLSASVAEKALVANGSSVQGLVDAGRVIPPGFPYPVTKVSEVFDAGRLSSGQPFELIAVEPRSLIPVLAPNWPRAVVSAVEALAASDARLPAISVGIGPGSQTVTMSGVRTDLQVVARLRVFPGMQPAEALVVVPVRALARPPDGALTYVWATGPAKQVESALARSTLTPSYLSQVGEFLQNQDVQNITRTYGFLRIVASALVLLSLVALLLYLSGRERSQLVTSAFLRRMGMSQPRQAAAVALESALLVALATAIGIGAALVTASAIVGRVDPLAQNAPAPVAQIQWLALLGVAVGLVAAAALLGAIATLAVRRSAVGEALRVA